MAIDFRAAIRYPFMGPNVFHAWLVPGALVLLIQLLSFAIMIGVRHYYPTLTNNQLVLLVAPFTVGTNMLLGGFLWHMAGALKTEGPAAILPSWRKVFGVYFRDGAKLFLYVFLINLILNLFFQLPFFTASPDISGDRTGLILALVLVMAIVLIPILAAPVIQAPPNYTLRELFHFGHAAALVKAHYKKGLLAMLMVLPIFLIYSVLTALLIKSQVAVVLIPFVIIAMLVTIWHLLTQGLTELPASWPESGDLRAI